MSSTHTHGRLVLRAAWALTSVVQQIEAQSRVGRYALARCVQKRNALTLVVWKKYALTLCVWKAKCPGTRHPEGICHGRCRPDATYLDTRRLEQIRPDTWRLEGICRGIRHPVGICRGVRRPDATCLDTRRPDEICPDTQRLEGEMPWLSSSGRHMLWSVSTGRHMP